MISYPSFGQDICCAAPTPPEGGYASDLYGAGETCASDLYGAGEICASDLYGAGEICASDLYGAGEICASDFYRGVLGGRGQGRAPRGGGRA